MRVPVRLFISHKTHEETEFALLYSDHTVVDGMISPVENTDGIGLDELRLVPGSIVPGSYDDSAGGPSIRLDDGRQFSLPGDAPGTANGDRFREISDRIIVEEFSNRFCHHKPVKPVQRSYRALVHQKPALADNFLVSWALGNTCNYACSYCPTWLHDGTQPWRDYVVVRDFCDRLIAQVPKNKTIVIEFSGGEVTLWKDYPQLCRHLKSKGVLVSMITNGYRTLDWWKENCRWVDVVQISYHTEFARHEQFLAVCNFLKEHVDLRVYVMMPPGRADQCVDVGGEIAALGISVALKPITEDLLGEMVAGYSESILERMTEFNATTGIQHITPASKSQTIEIRNNMMKETSGGDRQEVHVVELISKRENSWYGWECYSGPEQIVIDAEGYVYRGWCKVGNKLGHIADPAFRLVSEPVLCDKELCNCPFDMFSTKVNTSGAQVTTR